MSQRISLENAGRFALAGDAIITAVRPQRVLINGDTETVDPEKRFTYRIQRAKPKDGQEPDPKRPWFVKVLNGPDNNRDYAYLGTIFPAKYADDRQAVTYRHGLKSRIGADADSAKGIEWFVRHLGRLLMLQKEIEVADMFRKAEIEAEVAKVESTLNKLLYFHEGRCGRCARRLTVPESITVGLGPECLAKQGGIQILDFLAAL